MRRLALTLTSVFVFAVCCAAPARAADGPTVQAFDLSSVDVDTTNGNVSVQATVSVTGDDLVALGVTGRPSPDPGTSVPGLEGYSSPSSEPRTRIDAVIDLIVPAGYQRDWPLRLIAYGSDGAETDLTDQLFGPGILRAVHSKVTAVPRAPVGLKLVKKWTPSFQYNAYATWTRPDGPVPWGNRTTGTAGCGRNQWNPLSTSAGTSNDASVFLTCTATVRLVNDAGESAPVSASA